MRVLCHDVASLKKKKKKNEKEDKQLLRVILLITIQWYLIKRVSWALSAWVIAQIESREKIN